MNNDVPPEEQLALAIANLTTAMSVAFAAVGLFGPIGALLDSFEQLNRSVLPPGRLAELLQATVDTHREQLALAITESEQRELDS